MAASFHFQDDNACADVGATVGESAALEDAAVEETDDSNSADASNYVSLNCLLHRLIGFILRHMCMCVWCLRRGNQRGIIKIIAYLLIRLDTYIQFAVQIS